MLISRECDYALRVIRNLNGESVKAVSEIVREENLTLAMGYKVSRKLEKAGLIRSIRGRKGGYLLSRPASEISLLEIYHSIEPELLLIDCLQENYSCPNDTDGRSCRMHRKLCELQEMLSCEMDRIMLSDLTD